MKASFEVRLNGRLCEVEVQAIEGARYRVRVGDRVLDLDARRTEPGAYSVLAGTTAYEILTEPTGREDSVLVSVRGERYEIELLDERRRRMRRAAGGEHGSADGSISAPMPGKVVKLLAAPGDAVRAGQGVIVIEAMKMENELRARRDGIVREVRVSVGQAVEAREMLVVIE